MLRRVLPVAAGLAAAAVTAATAAPGSAAAHRPLPGVIRPVHVPATGWRMTQSTNWSGYQLSALATRTPFTSIGGAWVVPRARARHRGESEYSATWAGIGGGCVDTCLVTDETLIQAGTEQDVAADGTASYSAWWEIIPGPSMTVSLPVRPGDLMGVRIAEGLPGLWTITLVNVTLHKAWSTTVPYPSTEDTAEWILETPLTLSTSPISAIPALSVTHFDLANLNGAAARLNSGEAVQLVNGGVVVTPSGPDRDRDGFADCVYSTRCPVPLDIGQRR